jgi:LPS O-antigen subunit length determinant protein (WzzB/FepE family)
MNNQNSITEDEISLIDIYEFLKDGYKTILTTVVLSGIAGISIAFILPEKFVASANIQPARVVGNDVENINVLAEKMRSPTYYSQNTFAACDVLGSVNPAQSLVDGLKPNVAKASSFVSVSFKSKSTDTSINCLNAVLNDVIESQDTLSKPILERAINDLSQAKQRYETAKTKQEQELKQNRERLQLAKDKLNTARNFISKFENNTTRFNFKDEQFSASSLLLSTILSKQNEIKDLQFQINELEMKVQSAITGREDELLNIEKQINDAERNLLSPTTEKAKFATAIYSSPTKVEPKRSVITIVSVIAGGFIGLLILLLRRALISVRSRT